MKCGFSKEDSKGSPSIDVMTYDVDDDVYDEDADDDDEADDVGNDDDDDSNDVNENKSTQKKDFRAKKRTSKLKPCTYGVESGIELRPYWWKARAQNTAPSLSICN